MKILFVVNNYYASGNGLSASARRTVGYLREAGEEVRVLSGRNHEAETPQPDYVLGDFHVPVFDGPGVLTTGTGTERMCVPTPEPTCSWAGEAVFSG